MATDGDVVVVSVAAVEDLVLLLQPLSANPARIMLNKIVFFIGGLICPATDHVIALQFAFGPTVNSPRRKIFFAANAGAFFLPAAVAHARAFHRACPQRRTKPAPE